ncbi:TRAP transporter small permease [Acuticoccus yangtzensis]|uniref:TRAP transporter small permease n=1 Tax=Acuticoccus yangtzensis TaxID=1443441 RepID=UPI000AA5B461|nr:TRAP transporter small permease [Acuticoccus yangtzensis]
MTQTPTTTDTGPAPKAPDLSADVSALPGPLGLVDLAIAKVESVFLALGVLLMALNTVANVVSRYILGDSIYFSEELNQILIILITFAGISYAARHGRHIRMSAIYDQLPPPARKWLMVVIALVTAAFMFGLCYFAFTYLQAQMSRGRVLPALQIPVWWTIVWLPLGFFMTGVQYLLTAIKNIIEPDIYLSTSTLEGYGSDEIEV